MNNATTITKRLCDFYSNNPDATPSQAARATGAAYNTARKIKYLLSVEELDYNGVYMRNTSPAQTDEADLAVTDPDEDRIDEFQVGGDHYKSLSVQPWEAMEAWLTNDEFAGFLRGNVIKYLARAGSKGEGHVTDYAKAAHYLAKLITLYRDTTDE